MKRRDLMKHLADEGCVIFREGGNHTVIFRPENRRTSTVPRHREVERFLVRKICRDLGIAEPPHD